jgi:dihydroneopterin aldolase
MIFYPANDNENAILLALEVSADDAAQKGALDDYVHYMELKRYYKKHGFLPENST